MPFPPVALPDPSSPPRQPATTTHLVIVPLLYLLLRLVQQLDHLLEAPVLRPRPPLLRVELQYSLVEADGVVAQPQLHGGVGPERRGHHPGRAVEPLAVVGGPRYELPGRRQGRPVRAGELVAAGLDEPGVRALVGRGDPPEGAEGGVAVGRAAAGEGPEDAVEEGVAAAVDRRGPVRPDRGGGAPGRSARRRRVELLQQPLGEVGEVRLVLGPPRLGLLRGRPLLLPPLLELGVLLPLPRLPLALPLDLCVSCIQDERKEG